MSAIDTSLRSAHNYQTWEVKVEETDLETLNPRAITHPFLPAVAWFLLNKISPREFLDDDPDRTSSLSAFWLPGMDSTRTKRHRCFRHFAQDFHFFNSKREPVSGNNNWKNVYANIALVRILGGLTAATINKCQEEMSMPGPAIEYVQSHAKRILDQITGSAEVARYNDVVLDWTAEWEDTFIDMAETILHRRIAKLPQTTNTTFGRSRRDIQPKLPNRGRCRQR
ncbi:hypothetical protein QFC20_007210 [Naganishia adeliensis]|uniref:Uncharacterized protein n=1 Tax=Naganishia adeliensis TaxID=92952 RepID=A0ACC2V277_9TREE|nr:hypothetical protein QFC20_007210 [Naganishia adeliensis]